MNKVRKSSNPASNFKNYSHNFTRLEYNRVTMSEVFVKNINKGDKSWTFLDGSKRTVVILDSVAIGQGEYLPGWKWSEHVGAKTGKDSEAHIGFVISGQMIVQGVDGKETTIDPESAFEVKPGHDAWVVGDKPCIALDFEKLR